MSKTLREALLGATVAIVTLTGGAAAQAALPTLTGSIAVDNEFWAYLSTDDSVLGSLLVHGDYWPTTYSFTSAGLTESTYFLHVVGADYGPPEMFIGSFGLDAGYHFANLTTALTTNVTDWRATSHLNGDPWSAPSGTPQDIGPNGTSPWGTRPGVDLGAHYIWSNPYTGGAFFSTTITADGGGGGAVPEPASWAMMISGFGLAGAALRRRRTVVAA